MCGLVGVYYTNAACEPDRLTAMRDDLAHRGPDAAGNFIDGPVGLGHRRLSIIDLGTGQQPMQTADGRFVIAFNGEIYNYVELRSALESKGAQFRTHSDTEVILQLHAFEGDQAVERLNGIFAYAIWDKQRQRLLLARDRAGIKPLYFCSGPQGVAFSSEIKVLFRSGLITPRLDESQAAEYLLFRQVAGSENLFDGVRALAPGHTMEIIAGRPAQPRRYWSVRNSVPEFRGTFAEAVDALDSTLNAAVKRQLMSDVPLGTFCSGGIDSSLITAIAARHANRAINTFSVGFHEADFDESEYARLAASACRSTHHELRIDEAEYAALLPRLIWHHDLPLNFANSVHIYAVSKLAREHVTVVLTGEGADELFGGYPRYYIPRLVGHFRRIPTALRSVLSSIMSGAGDHRMRKLQSFMARSPDEALLYNCTGIELDTVLKALPRATAPALEFRKECIQMARRSGLDEVRALAQLEFQTYLLSILNRQDKMSMAASIEARVPFLDNEIIDFAASLPLRFKQTLRHRKRVLKEVALRYLPPQIVHRRKSGFGVPLRSWFAGTGPMAALLDTALHSTQMLQLMDGNQLQALVKEHRGGTVDHSEILWGVLNLYLWRETFAA